MMGAAIMAEVDNGYDGIQTWLFAMFGDVEQANAHLVEAEAEIARVWLLFPGIDIVVLADQGVRSYFLQPGHEPVWFPTTLLCLGAWPMRDEGTFHMYGRARASVDLGVVEMEIRGLGVQR